MSSNVATAKITDPTAVEARCTTRQSPYHAGAIFCECPELGFEGDNLIYCRYGLPLPNIQVADDSKLWIEATIGDRIRWKYTGFADSGGDVVLLKLISSSSAESFVLGDTLDTWITNTLKTMVDGHIHATTATVGPSTTVLGVISSPTTQLSVPSGHLSDKIKGE